MLANDIRGAISYLKSIPGLPVMSENRRRVLINMVFNMGLPSFLTFENMIAALRAKDFELAADEMLDSIWARKGRGRANELAKMMRAG